MKIYTVTFNNGGYRPKFTSVGYSEEDAIEKVLIIFPSYRIGFNAWASEFKIEGYVIEVYDEKTYNREKNMESLGL